MILGVDIDGTIKDTQRAAIEVHNRVLKRDVKQEEVKEFYLDKAYGLTPKEASRLWRKLEEEIYSLGIPLQHASEVLNELVKQGHQVYFITARPGFPNIVQVTKAWLKKHGFPYTGDNLIMNSQDKARKAKELGVELFFEDAPNHIENLVKHHVPTVIVDAVYNRKMPKEIKRITDWRQVYDLVEEHINQKLNET
ncbi:5' nucleotidase, NT5C type [Laceyella putida]|uniref:Nucleotidase n=1 Tax=Laceyella putida TaxID=110101 RepID=A0ABW2RK38_9BACL